MQRIRYFWWNRLLASGPQHALCMELTQALHAWQSWVPQNPRFALPHCPRGETHWEGLRNCLLWWAESSNRSTRGVWILPKWETVSAQLQTHPKVQWNVIRHTAAWGSNQRSLLPSGSSGTFDVTNQDLKGWSSRIQRAKGLWFLSVCESALP